MFHQRLICYQMAMSIAKAMPSLIARWPKGYYYLSDQLKRAIASIVLNIAEGNARTSPLERKRFFEISRSSLVEIDTQLEISSVLSLVTVQQIDKLKEMLNKLFAKLTRLLERT